MRRLTNIAALSALLTLSAFGQPVNWSQGVVYEYDGSGNVRKIGTDSYVYDSAQRLIRGSVAGSQQSYTYDSFGNRTACVTSVGGSCQNDIQIDSSTNRIASYSHDARGNLLRLPEGNSLEYDELGMLRKETGSGRAVYFIYTADDERIAVYDADTQLNLHGWRWTLRGLDKKPLREFTSDNSANAGTGNFRWWKDHVWRDSVLLASRQLDGTAQGGVSTYHYHVDHLGTPRQVTTSAAVIVGRHDYHPFGPELTQGNPNEPQQQNLKFTGHERDFVRDHPPLDSMHARYYEGRVGRFLSVDPGRDWDPKQPQSWNMYAYVRNNPVGNTDPDGRQVAKKLAETYEDAGERIQPVAEVLKEVAPFTGAAAITALAVKTLGLGTATGEAIGSDASSTKLTLAISKDVATASEAFVALGGAASPLTATRSTIVNLGGTGELRDRMLSTYKLRRSVATRASLFATPSTSPGHQVKG